MAPVPPPGTKIFFQAGTKKFTRTHFRFRFRWCIRFVAATSLYIAACLEWVLPQYLVDCEFVLFYMSGRHIDIYSAWRDRHGVGGRARLVQ